MAAKWILKRRANAIGEKQYSCSQMIFSSAILFLAEFAESLGALFLRE
jgi:hypothetical protein